MPKVASSVRSLILSAAIVALALPALAESMAEKPLPDVPDAGPPPGFECAAEPVTGSGPGFSSSRDTSEDAARAGLAEEGASDLPGSHMGDRVSLRHQLRGAGALLEVFRRSHSVQAEARVGTTSSRIMCGEGNDYVRRRNVCVGSTQRGTPPKWRPYSPGVTHALFEVCALSGTEASHSCRVTSASLAHQRWGVLRPR